MNAEPGTLLALARIGAGGLLLIAAVYLILMNFAIVLFTARIGKHVSVVSIFGGLFGAAGLWLANPFGYGHLWWAFPLTDSLALYAFRAALPHKRPEEGEERNDSAPKE